MAHFVLVPGRKRADGTPVATPAFLGPAIRGFFNLAGKVFNVSQKVFDQSTAFGRFVIKVFGPFSVPTQTNRTILEDIGAKLVEEFFTDLGKEELVNWIKEHHLEEFKAVLGLSKDGELEVVVTPGWFTDP